MNIQEISNLYKIDKNEFLTRADGRIEWICEHGVGHTVFNPNDWGEYNMTHGCDGCCSKIFKIINTDE